MKAYLNYFERTVILLFAVGTLCSAEECSCSTDEEIDCQDCISAQRHLCEALDDTNGRLDQAQNAVDKVKKACGSVGSAKVTEVKTKWLDQLDDFNRNCPDLGFTCD